MTESIKPATEKHRENTTSIYIHQYGKWGRSGRGRGRLGESFKQLSKVAFAHKLNFARREFQTFKQGSICSQVKFCKCGKYIFYKFDPPHPFSPSTCLSLYIYILLQHKKQVFLFINKYNAEPLLPCRHPPSPQKRRKKRKTTLRTQPPNPQIIHQTYSWSPAQHTHTHTVTPLAHNNNEH